MGTALLALLIAACSTTPEAPAPDASAEMLPALDRTATLALACSGCHSPAGGAMASLEGRTEDAIRHSLLTYKGDAAGTTVMHRMMRGYSEIDIDAISAYLAESAAP
ncbi:MAG: hypothetical protein KDA53_00720 [Hyphomonas sp.]|nr:hypothetical protein [Hyphomonas sp.]